jgi:hypothetical protein
MHTESTWCHNVGWSNFAVVALLDPSSPKNTKNVARPKNKKNKFVWGSRRVSLHTCPYTQRNTKGEKKRERERERKKKARERGGNLKKKQREREGERHIGGKKV